MADILMRAQDALDFRPEPLPHRGVQVAERLIQKRGGGIRSQRPRQGDPLLLTAGEFVGESASISGQAYQFQDFRHPFGAARVVEVLEAESYITLHRHVGEQRVFLHDHANAAVVWRGEAGCA